MKLKQTRIWLCAGLIVASGSAIGEVVGFEWANPTTRADGTALNASEIKRTEVYCGGERVAQVSGSGTAVQTDLPAGTNVTCYAITVATAKDDGTGESSSSPSVSVQVVIPKSLAAPSPPSGFSVR